MSVWHMGKGAEVMKKMNIMVGISDFEKIRKNGKG